MAAGAAEDADPVLGAGDGPLWVAGALSEVLEEPVAEVLVPEDSVAAPLVGLEAVEAESNEPESVGL